MIKYMTVQQARKFLIKQGYRWWAVDDGCNIKPDDSLSEYGILVVEDKDNRLKN